MKTSNPQKNNLLLRVLIKALLLVFIINYAFILFINVPIGQLSLYNLVFPGRERFPFGESPGLSYSMSLYNLDAMFSSHKIDAIDKAEDEYRVFVIGDSSIWGFLQKPEDTLAGILDSERIFRSGKRVKVYNLGYPSLSVVKDLMIIDQAKKYNPDLIIWMVTLESLPLSKQLETPLVGNNPLIVNDLIEKYDLQNLEALPVDYLDFSLISRRRELADLLRLQLYGVMWSATGIDQDYPAEYNPAMRDFDEGDDQFYDFEPPYLDESRLALDVITQTVKNNPNLDFMVVNEPVLVSKGENSDIRYNYYYPRWVYNQYRQLIQSKLDKSGIEYYDLWDIVPEEDFTNSAIHLNLDGEKILAERLKSLIEERN